MPFIPAALSFAKSGEPVCSNNQRTGHRRSKNACVTAETMSPAARPAQDIWSGRTAQARPSITAITMWYWATCPRQAPQPRLGLTPSATSVADGAALLPAWWSVCPIRWSARLWPTDSTAQVEPKVASSETCAIVIIECHRPGRRRRVPWST